MMRIFLSASVPLPSRHPRFFDSADVIAIRDSVKALAFEVLQDGEIVFGGHPAITPLLALILRESFPDRAKSIVLYQSEFFFDQFPPENDTFINVQITDAVENDREKSLNRMRLAMLSDGHFDAGVFIGGMEGVMEEYHLFKELNRNANVFPLASTGAAALQLFNQGRDQFDDLLINEFTYPTLFRRILSKYR